VHIKTRTFTDGAILGLTGILANQLMPVCYLFGFFDPRSCEVGLAPWQVFSFSIIAVVLLFRIVSSSQKAAFADLWQQNWLIAAFVFLALASNLWSVFPVMTIIRSIELLFLALIASYFGLRFTARSLLNFIAVSFGAFAVASVLVGIARPDMAIMSNQPYEGLWRGVFWHKVYFGAEMALGYVAYLTIALCADKRYRTIHKTFAVIMVVLCTWLAVLSDSASGLAVFAIQAVLVALTSMWLIWRHLLSRRAYAGLVLTAVGALLLAATHLEMLFKMLNRSSSMTGRVPLWSYLVQTYVAERPLFGFGLGAFWYQPQINERIQSVVKWDYGVGVSDSGIIDVLISLGGSGLILLLGMLTLGLWRGLKTGVHAKNLIGFFPFFVIAHVIFINISLSYFMESESFIWFILALTLFVSSRAPSTQAEPLPVAGK
jgi:exopolysaccharide production protein ExoQ